MYWILGIVVLRRVQRSATDSVGGGFSSNSGGAVNETDASAIAPKSNVHANSYTNNILNLQQC